jgi:thioredoxin 2
LSLIIQNGERAEAAEMPGDVVRCENCGRRNRVPAAATGTPRCGNCHQPLPWIVDAGDEDFTELAERASVPVLVDLWAPWCGPCRMVSPALAQLAGEMAGQLKLVKVNVDEAPKLQQRFGVQAIPTLMVLRKGQVIARQAGAAPAPALRAWLEQALQS